MLDEKHECEYLMEQHTILENVANGQANCCIATAMIQSKQSISMTGDRIEDWLTPGPEFFRSGFSTTTP